MVQIAPSILTADLGHLADEVAACKSADLVHLDVMDGRFVPPITFGADIAKAVVGSSALPVEAHLMVLSPAEQITAFKEAGCFRLIAHPEADPHFHRFALSARAEGLEVGVALNPGTPVSAVRWLLDVLDLVLVMTVNPGWGGQRPIPKMLEKIEALRSLGFEGTVAVDGGVNPETARLAILHGADELVAGSFVYGPGKDPAVQIDELRRAAKG